MTTTVAPVVDDGRHVIAELASRPFPALGTTALLCVAEADGLPAAHEVLEQELTALDEACSRFREDSELVRLNAAAGRGPVAVSPLLFEAIEVALTAAGQTGGLVDPTVGRTLRLAGYDRRFATVKLRDGSTFRPSFAPVPGWKQVELDPAARTVRPGRDVELDLGATAKALAADRIARSAALLPAPACSSASAATSRSTGRARTAAGRFASRTTTRPPPDEPGPTVALAAGGLATSGTTVRRWRAGEVALHHIVDPRTGRPADDAWRRSRLPGRAASTPTSRARRRSCSARRRPPGSSRAASPRGSSARPAR